MMTKTQHERDGAFMRAALSMARLGLGRVAPNPSVGCVIVDAAGHIIGRGVTADGGRPHAELQALEQAGGAAEGACVYVTLEPCAHHGVSAPCAEALIGARVSRVVAALEDPDARVAGKGFALLRDAGIEVSCGIEARAARVLHLGHLWRHHQDVALRRPMVTLKIATSRDGYMRVPAGQDRQITGAQTRAQVHFLRAQHDAIVTGIGTVLADNPRLDCRLPGMAAQSPRPIVMDRNARFPDDCALATRQGLQVFTENKAARGDYFVGLDEVTPHSVLHALMRDGMGSVLVEAGPQLSAAFLKADLVDWFIWAKAPHAMGASHAMGAPHAVETMSSPSDIETMRLDDYIGGASPHLIRYDDKGCGMDEFMLFMRAEDKRI